MYLNEACVVVGQQPRRGWGEAGRYVAEMGGIPCVQSNPERRVDGGDTPWSKKCFFSRDYFSLVRGKKKINANSKKMPAQAKKLRDPIGVAIRIDEKEGYEKLITEAFTPGEEIEGAFCIKHMGKTGRNPHFHLAVWSKVSKATLRARLNQIFNKGSGNGHMSLKEWDGKEKYIQYCLKECSSDDHMWNTIKLNSNGGHFVMYPPVKLVELRERSAEIVNDIKENTPTQIIGRIAGEFVDNGWNVSDKAIFTRVMKYLMAKGKWVLANKFQAERWVLQIRAVIAQIEDSKDGSEKSQDKLIDDLFQKYFLSY